MSLARRYGSTPVSPGRQELHEGFRVTAGLVSVQGASGVIRIPAGGVWPGADRLPKDVLEDFAPVSAHALHNATWEAAPADVSQGLALVEAQLLLHGDRLRRYSRASEWYGQRFTKLPDHLTGQVLGLARESVAALYPVEPAMFTPDGSGVRP